MIPLRKQKTIRLNYLRNLPNHSIASLTLLSDPAEARISVNEKQFIAVNETIGISLSPGMGNNINIQGMPGTIRYGGMLEALPFPMSIVPITAANPMPTQVLVPPLIGLAPTLIEMTAVLALFPA